MVWKYFIFLVFLIWMYGAIAQVQIFVFGTVHILGVHVKILLLITALPLLLINTLMRIKHVPQYKTDKNIIFSTKIWLTGTAIILLFSIIINEHQLSYLVFSANAMFFFPVLISLIILMFEPVSKNSLSCLNFVKIDVLAILFIYGAGIPILVFGIIQYLYNEPFILTGGSGDYLVVSSYDFIGGGIRAFSIFTSGLAFGKFALFLSLFWLIEFLNRQRYFSTVSLLVFVFFLLAQLAIFCTLTRSIYLHDIVSLIVLFLLFYNIKTKYINGIIIFSVLFGLAIIYLIPLLPWSFFGADGAFNTASIYARFSHWEKVSGIISEASFFQIIFGQGLMQNERFILTQGFIMDNVYIALFVYGGLLGLLTTMYFYYQLYKYLCNVAIRTRNSIWIATAAFSAGVPMASLFTVQINSSFLIILLAFICAPVFNKRPSIKFRLSNEIYGY